MAVNGSVGVADSVYFTCEPGGALHVGRDRPIRLARSFSVRGVRSRSAVSFNASFRSLECPRTYQLRLPGE